MKRILIMMLLAIPFAMTAQPIGPIELMAQGVVHQFPEYKGDEVIVRKFKSNTILIHHRDITEHNKHYYTLFRRNTSFPSISTVSGFQHAMFNIGVPTDYSIHDICIYDDTIYACGELYWPYGEPIYDPVYGMIVPVNIPQGFLAKIGMKDSVGSQWEMKYKIFDKVERLNKLTVYHPNPELSGFRKMIVATAELPSTYSQTSCLMEIKEELDGDWFYSIIHSDLSSREVLSDVLAMGNRLFVSSYLKGDENPEDMGHWFFYTHVAQFKGFTDLYVIPPMHETDLIGWNTSFMSTTHTGWGWHSGEGPMLMEPFDAWNFSLTFMSKNYATGGHGIVTVPLTTSLGAGYPIKQLTSYDTKLKDVSYLSLTNEITPLVYNPITSREQIFFLNMTVGGTTNCLYPYPERTYYLNSVDAFSGTRLVIGGSQTNNNTVVMIEQQHNCEDWCGSCLYNDFTESGQLESPWAVKMECNWKNVFPRQDYYELSWNTATGLIVPIEKAITCSRDY